MLFYQFQLLDHEDNRFPLPFKGHVNSIFRLEAYRLTRQSTYGTVINHHKLESKKKKHSRLVTQEVTRYRSRRYYKRNRGDGGNEKPTMASKGKRRGKVNHAIMYLRRTARRPKTSPDSSLILRHLVESAISESRFRDTQKSNRNTSQVRQVTRRSFSSKITERSFFFQPMINKSSRLYSSESPDVGWSDEALKRPTYNTCQLPRLKPDSRQVVSLFSSLRDTSFDTPNDREKKKKRHAYLHRLFGTKPI